MDDVRVHSNGLGSPHQTRLPKTVRIASGTPWAAVTIIIFSFLLHAQRASVASFIASYKAASGRRLAGDDSTIGFWIGGVLVATLTKLVGSVDDVVWLLPFLSGKRGYANGAFYIFCVQLVVALAWGVSLGGTAAMSLVMPTNDEWPVERVLELMSACLLTVYALKLFVDWWRELGESDDHQGSEAGAESVQGTVAELDLHSNYSFQSCVSTEAKLRQLAQCEEEPAALPVVPDAIGLPSLGVVKTADCTANVAPAKEEVPSRHAFGNLFTITMFGSLDDFAVFVSVMLSGVLSVSQLLLGVLLGCCIVLVVCKGAGAISCVSTILEKIPLWSIIGCFAGWTFLSCTALNDSG